MTTYPVPGGQTDPQSARAANVDIGRLDFLSTFWRLTRMELYKLHHRTYSRVVLAILFILVVLFTVLVGLSSHGDALASPESNAPLQCSAQVTTHCTTQHYTHAQLLQMKDASVRHDADSLGFPTSLGFIMLIFSYGLVAMLGLLLLAPIIGTEYSLGTIRLLLTRGPTRLQYMLGKALAGLIYTAEVLLLLTLTYIIVGMLVYPLTGEPYAYVFGHFHEANFGTVFGNALWLTGITLVFWYAFVALAIFFGTLGRSTAAALGGAFAWFILETLLPFLLGFLAGIFSSGPIHGLLQTIPDYLFLNNLSALVQNRMAALDGAGTSTISDLHATLVVGVYLLLLLGSSCLITMRRDITN